MLVKTKLLPRSRDLREGADETVSSSARALPSRRNISITEISESVQRKRNEQMKRGQLAKLSGITAESVRYYEKRGLIREPPRTASGYRMYSEDYITRIRFIKRVQDLGFTLREIQELLSLRVAPDSDRADVRKQVNEKISSIELKIEDLQRIKAALEPLVSCCSGRGSTLECPILEFMDAA